MRALITLMSFFSILIISSNLHSQTINISYSEIRMQYNVLNTSPIDCHIDLFQNSDSTDGICLIELISTDCDSSRRDIGTCEANAVLAIDADNGRLINYFENFSTNPEEGACYPISETQKIKSSKQGTISTKSTGEICVVSDEPGLSGVTIYLHLNGNGAIPPDTRDDTKTDLIISSNGTVLGKDHDTWVTVLAVNPVGGNPGGGGSGN